MECSKCGACCVAPDIKALDKPLAIPCRHLTAENLCGIYAERPQICRDYQADVLCEQISAPTLGQRVERYLAIFGLTDEGRRNRERGVCSMAQARRVAEDGVQER